MAEETQNNPTDAPKKVSMKTLIVVAVVLVIEGVAISAVFLMSGSPATVQAEGAAMDPEAALELPTEVLVVADKFQNTRRGRAYLYDTEVHIVVKNRYQADIEKSIEAKRATITADISTIMRKAEPAHLMEPELATLKRQIRAALDKRLGYDEDGEPYIQEVLILRCDQYRNDG